VEKRILTNTECEVAAKALTRHYFEAGFDEGKDRFSVYGVPRGGIPVAYLVNAGSIECPSRATLIVDDVVDSGRTRDRYRAQFPNTPFLALADFLLPERVPGQWIVFPWEQGETDLSGEDICVRLLQHIGEDPKRGGLLETPARFLKAWKEWTSGYGADVPALFKCFEDGAENYDQMIVVKDLPFFSHCEHHLAPFFGTASIAYIPAKRIVGLSKLGRVLEAFARRLQVQERLTAQVADAIEQHLQPKGVGVLIRARHLCMESRGYSKQGHQTVTSALRGEMLTDNKARQEFLAMARA
jgi:GTP cyclohydrolase I